MADDADDATKPLGSDGLDDLFKNLPEGLQHELMDIALPGARAAWDRFGEDFRFAFDLEAARHADPVALATMRIVQAVLVAARRGDVTTLRAWENKTFRYMCEHALDEYIAMSLPPRPASAKQKHDRHIILARLRERVAKFMREYKPPLQPLTGVLESALNQVSALVQLHAMVQGAFSHLKVVAQEKWNALGERFTEHLKAGRPLSEIDPEEVILAGLESLGVARATAWGWLRGADES